MARGKYKTINVTADTWALFQEALVLEQRRSAHATGRYFLVTADMVVRRALEDLLEKGKQRDTKPGLAKGKVRADMVDFVRSKKG